MDKSEIEKLIQKNAEAFDALKKQIPELTKSHVDPLVKAIEENATKAMDKFEEKLEKHAATEKALENEIALLKAMPASEAAAEAKLEDEYMGVVNKFFKGEKYTQEDIAIVQKCQAEWAKKDQIVGNPSEGGLTVMPTFSNRITQRRFESSPMRQLASVNSITTEEWIDWYDDSEVSADRAPETSPRVETDGVFLHEVKIPIHDQFARIPVSRKLLRSSSINWPSYLHGKVGAKMARNDNFDFIRHDGTIGAKGILAYATSPTGEEGKFDTLERVDIGSIDYAGLVALQDSLFDEFQGNASWLMRRQTRSKLRLITDSQQRPLWEPSLQKGAPALFLGAPVFAAADMPEATGTNESIAYGDFRTGYQIIDRVGMEVVVDEVTDQRYKNFNFHHALGGGVIQFQAIKIGKMS